MNHPCALCDNYGHYSHHCPRLEDFHHTLQVLHELEVSRSESTSSLPTVSIHTSMLEQEVSLPPTVIPPLEVKMIDSTSPILYLLASIGLIYWDSLNILYCDSVDLPRQTLQFQHR